MMDYMLWALMFVGHLAIWCVIFNRIHATALPRWFRKLTEKLIVVAVLIGFVWFAYLMFFNGTISVETIVNRFFFSGVYLSTNLLAGVYFALRWGYRKFIAERPAELSASATEVIDVRQLNDNPIYVGPLAKALELVPGNQSHLVAIERKTLALPGVCESLSGLKICHLSDFHLTGQLDIGYYTRIVEEVNQFDADLVLITGDLIDEHECLNWIDKVFGGLQSKHGVFYVLGNHDKRIKNEPLLRKMLSDSGLIAVNGRWVTQGINGVDVAIAGNELPWFGGAEKLQPYSKSVDDVDIELESGGGTEPAVPNHSRPFKILLSHAPDQLKWAQGFEFDLMLAGHTHGGQIQIPLVGPIVAPSRYGVKYASGTFMMEKMLMHVSRGIAGDKCIRINCLPEVGFFTLTAVDR